MRSQTVCQLGSNIACLTIDRAEHIARYSKTASGCHYLSVVCNLSQDMGIYGVIFSDGNVIIFFIFWDIIPSSVILRVELRGFFTTNCRNQF